MLLLSIPFPRISMFWVEIPGRRGLVSLPFPGKNSCLSRDFWQVEIGFSTHFAGFPVLGRDSRQAGFGFSTHFAGFRYFG